MRHMLKSKLHRVTVTEADVDYEGSLTVDDLLLQAADIIPFEMVDCWNVTRGTRFRTYAMRGPAGSGVICANGAAAHLAQPGDLLIVATFCELDDPAAWKHQPVLVFVDEKNRMKTRTVIEAAGPEKPLHS